MICQDCGVEAPTKHVSFHQNVGALVMRFSKSIEGQLCKSCIHKRFWSMTGTTLVCGWWGTVSFIVTPLFILNNFGRYLTCLSMEPVPPGATRPTLSDGAVARINSQAERLFERLNRGEDFQTVATSIAESTGTTPAQVALYVQAVIQAQAQPREDGAV
jgi:hypothetical protein